MQGCARIQDLWAPTAHHVWFSTRPTAPSGVRSIQSVAEAWEEPGFKPTSRCVQRPSFSWSR